MIDRFRLKITSYFHYGGKNVHIIKLLKKQDINTYLLPLIEMLYMYTRPKKRASDVNVYLTDCASNVGKAVVKAISLRVSSIDALRIGLFFIEFLEEEGVLKIVKGWKHKNQIYVINVINDEYLRLLWSSVPKEKRTRLPVRVPVADWEGSRHQAGKRLVKTFSKEVLETLTPQTHPLVFKTLNTAQKVGWQINQRVFDVQRWAIVTEERVFQDIFENLDQEARKTKLREAATIFHIADALKESVFYHLYYLDFRGRKYVDSPYLHEQGSDVARGLLLREDSKEIGESGLFWLFVNLANTWGGKTSHGLKSDKLPIILRAKWAEENLEMFLSFAKDPYSNKGWMDADKPWQHLAACFELEGALREGATYRSHLEVFIDGSNNGSQHLTMLTKDHETAPLVNLVAQEVPGDLYAHVAIYMWQFIEKELLGYSPEIIKDCELFIDKLIQLKKNGDFEGVRDLKKKNQILVTLACPVFWARITDIKERRKIVKRNVLSLPYGATPYGLGNQQWDDAKKHGIELLYYLEPVWGYWFGRKLFIVAEELLVRPMRLLRVFEKAGEECDLKGSFLKWTVPKTNFPCQQHYVQGKLKKVHVKYNDLTLQLHLRMAEEPETVKNKQAQGAAPNIIHSLDAAHLMLTVNAADFCVTTVHDSYGCLLGDMSKLYPLVRKTLLALYEEDVLETLLAQIDMPPFKDYGTFCIREVLEAQYAFI